MAYQKFPNSKQLLTELNSKKLDKIYLFLGEEEGEKEKAINKIIDLSIKDQDEKSYSTGRFHLESEELNNAAEFAVSESMFSEKKICVMLNVNSLKAKGGDKELLKEIINTLPDSNILIMTSQENKVPSAIDSGILGKIKTVQFWKLFDSDIAAYAYNKFKKNNLEADRTAIRRLIELTGRDIRKLDEAVEMIIESGEKQITLVVIDKFVSDTKEVSVFEFIEALFQKDKNSFFQLSRVLDSGIHELTILKLIMRQAELIEKYFYLVKDGMSTEAALQETGINSKNTKSFISSTQCFSRESIKNIFPLIYSTDQRIKSSIYSDNLASNPVFELVTDILLAPSVN
jgi:DNA polymerase III delta subunit